MPEQNIAPKAAEKGRWQMRIFRPTVPNAKGGRGRTARWYVDVKDPEDRWRSVRGFTDRRMTENLGRCIEALLAYRINREPPDATLAAWLEGLTPYLRGRLEKIGALDPRRVAAGRPLAEHLDDFRAALLARDCTQRHANLVEGRARRIIEECSFKFWSDLSASKAQAYLADLRADKTDKAGKVKRGISHQTSNWYLGACKQFCRWMVRDGRAVTSPVAYLEGLNVRTDRRHDRRALSIEELQWLLATTRSGPARYGMNGPERAVLYRLAVESGLRAGELRSLTRASFALDAEPPTVTVEAEYSKRRREDVLLLRPDTAAALRTFMAGKLPVAPVFAMPSASAVAKMLRADLAAARAAWLKKAPTPQARAEWKQSDFLEYRNAAGRVADFHSLRHTFISNLAASGCHPKTAQALARHSTITLTMDRYTHGVVGDEAAALAALPDLSVPPAEAARDTGTDGAGAAPVPYDLLTKLCGPSRTKANHDVRNSNASAIGNMAGTPKKPQEISPFANTGGEAGIRTQDQGLSPDNGLANRRFRPLSHLSARFAACILQALYRLSSRGAFGPSAK